MALVVFECKAEGNPDSPLAAVLEGLDYLGHLAIPANIASLKEGFGVWLKKSRNEDVLLKVPGEFRDATIKPEARHAVIVLAPQEYFSFHMQDVKKKSQDWHLLSDRARPETVSSVDLDFAISDFESARCPFLTL